MPLPLRIFSFGLFLAAIGMSAVHAEQPRLQTVADAIALVLARSDLSPQASLERVEGAYVGDQRNWRIYLRDGKAIHTAVVRSDGRVSQSMRADDRSEQEAEYWTNMPPVAQTVGQFLGASVIEDASARIQALDRPLTGAYLVRYTARRPHQGERVALHTVEVTYELADEERKGKRVVYREGVFQELTDVRLMKITIPGIAVPSVRAPRVEPPTIEPPEIKVPIPRFPEQQYPVIDVPELSGPGVRLQEGADLAIITLDGAILFDFDQSELRTDARTTLQRILNVLNSRYPGAALEIHGHTDSMGTLEYNQTLSERRAESVGNWLVARGIPAERLQIIGFGETTPVAPNARPDGSDYPEGRQKNRRVEVVIHKTTAEQPR
jgi:photosystem I P700 chlorophyll a apoprotein A2